MRTRKWSKVAEASSAIRNQNRRDAPREMKFAVYRCMTSIPLALYLHTSWLVGSLRLCCSSHARPCLQTCALERQLCPFRTRPLHPPVFARPFAASVPASVLCVPPSSPPCSSSSTSAAMIRVPSIQHSRTRSGGLTSRKRRGGTGGTSSASSAAAQFSERYILALRISSALFVLWCEVYIFQRQIHACAWPSAGFGYEVRPACGEEAAFLCSC